MCPIFKTNKNPDISDSYRPITLLSCVGKMLENILTERLLHKSLKIQYGFRKGSDIQENTNLYS